MSDLSEDDDVSPSPYGGREHNPNDRDEPDYERYYTTTKGYEKLAKETRGAGTFDSDSESSWSSHYEEADELRPLPGDRNGPKIEELVDRRVVPGRAPEYAEEKAMLEDEDDQPTALIKGSSIKTNENLNSVRVIRFGRTNDKLGIQFGLKTSRFTGPLVTIASVERDSQADLRGIQNDWVLTHLDGEPINVKTSEEFSKFINEVARKRSIGLTLSFNTMLLKRLKKRMSVQYLAQSNSAREEGLRRSRLQQNARYKLREAMAEGERCQRSRQDRANAIESLRLAIEFARRQGVDIDDFEEADQMRRRLVIAHEFDKLKEWDNASWTRKMTDHEIELTDLEERIAGLEATVNRAKEEDIDTRGAEEVIWKLKGLYKCSEKLPPMSRDTRMRILAIQEIALDLHTAEQMDDNRRRVRQRELKHKIQKDIREASNQQRPAVLKELIATMKQAQLECAYWQEILDVINGVCDHCCQQHVKAMRTIAKDCDELNVDAQGIKEFADWLDTQKVQIRVRLADENSEREERAPKRKRYSFSRKKRTPQFEEDDEKMKPCTFDMFKFHSVKDLKMKAFEKLGLSIFAQVFYKKGEVLDDEQTLLSEVFTDKELFDADGNPQVVHLKLFVKEWETTKWVSRTVLEDLKMTMMNEAKEMENAKESLVVAIEDRDFHNFLRYSSTLRKHWCKMEISRRHRVALEDQIEDHERLEQRENAKRRQENSLAGYGSPIKRHYYDEESDYGRPRGYNETPGRVAGGPRRPQLADDRYRSPRVVGRDVTYGGVRSVEETPGRYYSDEEYPVTRGRKEYKD